METGNVYPLPTGKLGRNIILLLFNHVIVVGLKKIKKKRFFLTILYVVT